jgi:HlyD family secretion protein
MVLNDLRQQHVRLMVVEHDTLRIDLASLQQERTNLVVSLGNYDKQIDTLLRKLDRQREALKQGLIVESAFLTTEIDLFSTQQAKAQAELKLTQMEATEKNERTQVEQQSTARQQRIDETQHALDLLKKQLELSSIVTSPYAGRVLEVTVDEGNLIASGKRILSLEKVEQDLEAVVFVPAREGKRVKPEMTVRVYPSTVAKTTSGCMMGKVSSVSPFPSTPEGMMRVLRNEELARQMGARGAPIEVHVQLEKTADRAYRWSSGRVTASVNSGTLCDASIIIEEVRPLSLVVPLLKDYVGAN